MSEDEILKQANFMSEKERTVKKGGKVLHIDYLGVLLSNDDLLNFKIELQKIGIELSYYDKSGVIYNSLDDLSGVVRQILGSEVTHNILIGVVGSAVWEGLCKVWIFSYKKLKGKKITKFSVEGPSIKDATMSIVLKLNSEISIEYNLRGDLKNEEDAFKTFKNVLNNAKSLKYITEFLENEKTHDLFIELHEDAKLREAFIEILENAELRKVFMKNYEKAKNKIPRSNFVAEANFESKSVKIIDTEKFFRDKIENQNK